MKKVLVLIMFIFIFPVFQLFQAAEKKVDILFHQKVKARDGIMLNVDVYKPENMTEPLPALFVFTPYTTDGFFKDAMFYSRNGYVVVIGDIRGRGNSGGEWIPFEYEGKDGYDICNWISEQKWCNGKIGMFGGSYVGMVQWLILKEKPNALKTIVPTATVCPGVDFPMQNNIFYTYNTQWLTFTLGQTLNRNAFVDTDYWNSIFAELFIKHIPYAELDSVSGMGRDKNFQNWIKHDKFDDYFRNILPNSSDYSEMNIPILTITGHFDDDQPGTLHYYSGFMNNASQDVKNKSYIVIGPWNHGGTRKPTKEHQNLVFGENSVLDMQDLHLKWFNWVLKDSTDTTWARPSFLKNNVVSYEMGTNEWRYAPSMEKLVNSDISFYLHSVKRKDKDTSDAGLLSFRKPDEEKPDSAIYNPLDTTGAMAKIQNQMIDFAWRDEKESYAKDKLIYHSEPLEKDVVFTGKAKLNAYISIDVPDTDFEAILYEISADGKCIYLTSAFMRARFRDSPGYGKLVKKNEVFLYEFDNFHFTSRKLMKGSRLRLVFGALNSPYYQKNYNSGGDVSFESAKDANTAIIKIWHNEDYPSSLILPVAK